MVVAALPWIASGVARLFFGGREPRINRAEVVLVVAIVFVAAFMARVAWLY
jgi:hypothetical protein